MDILKKLGGIFLILLALLFAIATVVTSLNAFNGFSRNANFTYIAGSLLGIAICISIVFKTAQVGLKLLNKNIEN